LRQQGVYMLSREIQERGVIMKKVKLLLVAVVLGMTVMCSVPAGAAPSKSGPTLAWKLWGEHADVVISPLVPTSFMLSTDYPIAGVSKPQAKAAEDNACLLSSEAVVFASVADSPMPMMNADILKSATAWNNEAWAGYAYAASGFKGGYQAYEDAVLVEEARYTVVYKLLKAYDCLPYAFTTADWTELVNHSPCVKLASS
jgi:hypothetical protein